MSHPLKERTELRKIIRLKRNALSPDEQHLASIQLKQQLCNLPYIQNARHIALYLANDGELDPMPFIRWCWQHNKQVYLPVIHPFNRHNLLFLSFDEKTSLQNNRFGILEPKLNVQQVCPIEMLDVLCTPLVAFDNNGNRLGMGGGFYDRTLAKWFTQQSSHTTNCTTPHNNSLFYPIGIAHNCQRVDSIPLEQWDIPLPEIITPSKRYLKS